MSARVIFGFTGGGKTRTAVDYAWAELRDKRSNRWIVTNIEVYPGHAAGWCKARFGIEIDPERIIMLDDEQTKEFYRYRPEGFVVPLIKDALDPKMEGRLDWKRAERTNPATGEVEVRDTKTLPGVVYLIDEAHFYFNADNYRKRSENVSLYLNLRRKFNDEIFFITPNTNELDKRLRDNLSEWWECHNTGQRVVWGYTPPDAIKINVYARKPNLFTPKLDSFWRQIDSAGLCSTYNTASGAGGIRGAFADINAPKKGKSWKSGLVKLAAVGLALVTLPVLGLGYLGGLQKEERDRNAKSKLTNAPPAQVVSNTAPVVPVPPVPPPTPAAAPAPSPAPAPALVNPLMQAGGSITNGGIRVVNLPPPAALSVPRLRFFIRRGDDASLGLDTGETFTVESGRLQIVGRLAVVDGNRVFRIPE